MYSGAMLLVRNQRKSLSVSVKQAMLRFYLLIYKKYKNKEKGHEMSAVHKVLVIGGGFSGMSTAIKMRRHGIEVDLAEIDPEWCELGAGITLNGASMRALESLGLYDQVVEQGCVTDSVAMRLAHGPLIMELPTPSPVGSSVGGSGGIFRPTLARIMSNATLESGVNVRLGALIRTFRTRTQE
ncbi:FAD-dependent monooxygenase [Vibrio sp. PP-XX7]